MKTNHLAIYAILPFLGACGTMIKPGEMAMKNIILDEPALRQDILPEGFYWQWPWNSMVSYDVTAQSRDEKIGVLTKDSLHVPTTVTVTFRPRTSQLYQLHTKIGTTYYEDIIGPAFVTLVRTEFSRYNHNDLAKESKHIEDAVLTQLQNELKGMPVEIDQVSIKHIRYEKLVTKSISDKLVKEQEIQQKQYEIEIAKKDADIARTAASGIGELARSIIIPLNNIRPVRWNMV